MHLGRMRSIRRHWGRGRWTARAASLSERHAWVSSQHCGLSNRAPANQSSDTRTTRGVGLGDTRRPPAASVDLGNPRLIDNHLKYPHRGKFEREIDDKSEEKLDYAAYIQLQEVPYGTLAANGETVSASTNGGT